MNAGTKIVTGFGATVLVSAAAASLNAQPTVMDNTIEARAMVESVDQTQRSVLLRGEHGELDTIIAGPEVRNLAQVRAGDRVVVRVHEPLVLDLSKPGSPPLAGPHNRRLHLGPWRDGWHPWNDVELFDL